MSIKFTISLIYLLKFLVLFKTYSFQVQMFYGSLL